MSRDDFSSAVKEALSKRVALRCSNPKCRLPTHGPHSIDGKAINLGVASHISAASEGGPRYDATLTSDERASIANAIWLCQSCAKLIDRDPVRFSTSILHAWKGAAETKARSELEERVASSPQVPARVQHSPLPPSISGLTYHAAREQLIALGWQPLMRHWSHVSHPNVIAGREL